MALPLEKKSERRRKERARCNEKRLILQKEKKREVFSAVKKKNSFAVTPRGRPRKKNFALFFSLLFRNHHGLCRAQGPFLMLLEPCYDSSAIPSFSSFTRFSSLLQKQTLFHRRQCRRCRQRRFRQSRRSPLPSSDLPPAPSVLRPRRLVLCVPCSLCPHRASPL